MIELLFNSVFLIIGIYVSIFTWITKKDIESNEKNDFYVPASFLIAFSAIGMTVLLDGSDEGKVFSAILLVFTVPVILKMLIVGSKQDLQKARGDPTYNVGDWFWIVRKEGVTLDPEQAVLVGKNGRIKQIYYEEGVKSASMVFDEGRVVRFQLVSLSKNPPAVEEKGWWNS